MDAKNDDSMNHSTDQDVEVKDTEVTERLGWSLALQSGSSIQFSVLMAVRPSVGRVARSGDRRRTGGERGGKAVDSFTERGWTRGSDLGTPM